MYNQSYDKLDSQDKVLLKVSNVHKSYNKLLILNGLDFTIMKGEAVALIGPNGIGKSTTLKIIVGIESLDSGYLDICGKNLRYNPVNYKKSIGYLADEPFLYDRLTGHEYLSILSNVYQYPLDRAIKLAEEMGLSNGMSQICSSYSLGMKHKLAFVGAIFHEPELLILDEPFMSFDTDSREYALKLCEDHISQGRSILFSTHELGFIEKLATRALLMEEGKSINLTLNNALNIFNKK